MVKVGHFMFSEFYLQKLKIKFKKLNIPTGLPEGVIAVVLFLISIVHPILTPKFVSGYVTCVCYMFIFI